MKFTVPELALINFALQTTGEKTPEGLPIGRDLRGVAEITYATSAFEKIKATAKAPKEGGEPQLVESEIEFSTEEKALMKKFIDPENRQWAFADAPYVLGLMEKLSK